MDILIVALIVVLAAGYVGRSLWRSFHGRNPSCGGCNACSTAGCSLKQGEPVPGSATPDRESPAGDLPEDCAGPERPDE